MRVQDLTEGAVYALPGGLLVTAPRDTEAPAVVMPNWLLASDAGDQYEVQPGDRLCLRRWLHEPGSAPRPRRFATDLTLADLRRDVLP